MHGYMWKMKIDIDYIETSGLRGRSFFRPDARNFFRMINSIPYFLFSRKKLRPLILLNFSDYFEKLFPGFPI